MLNTEQIDRELMEMARSSDYSLLWDDLLTEGKPDMKAWLQRIALYIAQNNDEITLHQFVEIVAMARTGILQEIMSRASLSDVFENAIAAHYQSRTAAEVG